MSVPRCELTGNPCGTDTLPAGSHCVCATCQQFMQQRQPLLRAIALEIFGRPITPGGDSIPPATLAARVEELIARLREA